MKNAIAPIVLTMICIGIPAGVPRPAGAGSVTLGGIDADAWKEIKKMTPLSAFLEKELKPDGIDQVKIVVTKSIPEMAAALREKKIDLYLDSPYPTIAVSRLSGAKLLLRRWKKGVSDYHSLIFARKDAGIDRLEDLKGKMIALEDPWSSSGYFFPKLAMIERGLKLLQKGGPTDPVGAQEVGYLFTHQEENMMLWVLKRRVGAGAMDDASYANEARGQIDSLKVLYQSSPIPRHIVSHRADLPASVVVRIKEILINMERTADGRQTLIDFEKTTRFDEIPPRALDFLLKARGLVESELGIK